MRENKMEQFCRHRRRRRRHCRFSRFSFNIFAASSPDDYIAIVGIHLYSCRKSSEKCISTYMERMQLAETVTKRIPSPTIYVRLSLAARRRQPNKMHTSRVNDHTGPYVM